jgi:hypothetical protein
MRVWYMDFSQKKKEKKKKKYTKKEEAKSPNEEWSV